MLTVVWKDIKALDIKTFNVQRLTVLGLGGGLFAHLLYGLTDAIALGAKPGLLFWMLLGLITGLYEQMIASPKRSSLR
jgi:hypothetical protein